MTKDRVWGESSRGSRISRSDLSPYILSPSIRVLDFIFSVSNVPMCSCIYAITSLIITYKKS